MSYLGGIRSNGYTLKYDAPSSSNVLSRISFGPKPITRVATCPFGPPHVGTRDTNQRIVGSHDRSGLPRGTMQQQIIGERVRHHELTAERMEPQES